MSGNINVANYAHGGKTRINQQPGGNSNINLGWQQSNQNDYRDKSPNFSYNKQQNYQQQPRYSNNVNTGEYIPETYQANTFNNPYGSQEQPEQKFGQRVEKQDRRKQKPQQQAQSENFIYQHNEAYNHFQDPNNFNENKNNFKQSKSPFNQRKEQYNYNQNQNQYNDLNQQQQKPLGNFNQPKQDFGPYPNFNVSGKQPKQTGINHPMEGFSNGYKVNQPPGGKSQIVFG